MRRASAVLSAILLLAACKGDDAETTTTGPDAHCSDGYGDGPEVDPDYPSCGCDPGTCSNGGLCRVSGPSPAWTSSLCHPTCNNGPTCTDPDYPCDDNDCPLLGQLQPSCFEGVCVLYCNPGCPAGYVCADNGQCQVSLE